MPLRLVKIVIPSAVNAIALGTSSNVSGVSAVVIGTQAKGTHENSDIGVLIQAVQLMILIRQQKLYLLLTMMRKAQRLTTMVLLQLKRCSICR